MRKFFPILSKPFQEMDMLSSGLEITLFRSRRSELSLLAEVASMCVSNGQLAKYKLEVLHTKVYMPWYSGGEST